MRYVFAISALVLSGVLLLLGIGQRTFLAGPAEIVYVASDAGSAPYAVIPAGELKAEPGQANIVVAGTDAFVAVGSTRDVEAWTAPFDHELLTSEKDRALAVTPLRGDPNISFGTTNERNTEAQKPVDPRGSDLWLEERSTNPEEASAEADAAQNTTGDQTVRLPVSLRDDQSVIIATDGKAPAPSEISVAWMQDRKTPLAGPFLAAGGLLALIGGILYLLAFDHDRRGLGPRRGRKGPLQGVRNIFQRPKKRAMQRTASEHSGARRRATRVLIPAAGLSLMLGLTGCSASYWPDFSKQQQDPAATEEIDENAAPVPVTEGQIDNIVSRVAEAAAVGDKDLDAEALAERFTGDALTQREANYKIRKAVPDYEILPPTITDEGLGYELVQSTEGWPRTLFVTVASESAADTAKKKDDTKKSDAKKTDAKKDTAKKTSENSPSLALILTQESPHENFLVSRVISLSGGIAMPPAAPVSEGTALLPDDLKTLALEPREVGESYAKILVEGTDEASAKKFDLTDDLLLEKSGSAWVRQAQKAADDEDQKVRYSVVAKQGDESIVSLSTGTGGALVAATVIEERTEEGKDNWKPTAVGSVSALSGLEGSHPKLVRELAHQVLFFVPSGDSGEKIQILGATSELVGARK